MVFATTPLMESAVFVRHVEKIGHFQSPAQARRSIEAVLSTLRVYLNDADVAWLCGQLPREIATSLLTPPGFLARSTRSFFEIVSRLEGVTLGMAIEHAFAVTTVISSTLSEESCERIRARLPANVWPLFGGPRANEIALESPLEVGDQTPAPLSEMGLANGVHLRERQRERPRTRFIRLAWDAVRSK